MARADSASDRYIGAAVAALPSQQVNGDASRSPGIGDRVVAATADHRGIRSTDHYGIVAIAAIQRCAGGRATDDHIAEFGADHVLDTDQGIAVRAGPELQVYGDSCFRVRIGSRIRTKPANDRGVGCIDHKQIVAAIAIQRRIGRGTTDDHIAEFGSDGILDVNIRIAVAARLGLQVDGHTCRRICIGHGVRSRAADHRGIGRVDHNGIAAATTVQRRIGRGTANDHIAEFGGDHILDVNIRIAATAASGADLEIDCHACLSRCVRNGIVATAAYDRDIRAIDHDNIVPVVTIQRGIGGRAPDNKIVEFRGDYILDIDQGIAVRAGAGLEIDRHTRRCSGIGNRIAALPADHGGV